MAETYYNINVLENTEFLVDCFHAEDSEELVEMLGALETLGFMDEKYSVEIERLEEESNDVEETTIIAGNTVRDKEFRSKLTVVAVHRDTRAADWELENGKTVAEENPTYSPNAPVVEAEYSTGKNTYAFPADRLSIV